MEGTKIILTHLAIGQPCVLLPSLPVYITFSILIAPPVRPDLKKENGNIYIMADYSKNSKSYARYLVYGVIPFLHHFTNPRNSRC